MSRKTRIIWTNKTWNFFLGGSDCDAKEAGRKPTGERSFESRPGRHSRKARTRAERKERE